MKKSVGELEAERENIREKLETAKARLIETRNATLWDIRNLIDEMDKEIMQENRRLDYFVEKRKHLALELVSEEKNTFNSLLGMPVEKEECLEEIDLHDTNLSARAVNAMKRSGFHTVEDLRELTMDELRCIRCVGTKTANEIISVANEYGIELCA